MCSITSQKLPDCVQALADFLLRSFICKAKSRGCIVQPADISAAHNHFLCRCYELCAAYKKGKASLSTFLHAATRHDVSRYWYSFIADKIKREGKADEDIDTPEMDVENIPATYADFRNLLMIRDDLEAALSELAAPHASFARVLIKCGGNVEYAATCFGISVATAYRRKDILKEKLLFFMFGEKKTPRAVSK